VRPENPDVQVRCFQFPLGAYADQRTRRETVSLDSDIPDPKLAVFGYGLRICPGGHIALDFIWITAVSILTTFSIEELVGVTGKLLNRLENIVVCYSACLSD
jgi:hypothetical protein